MTRGTSLGSVFVAVGLALALAPSAAWARRGGGGGGGHGGGGFHGGGGGSFHAGGGGSVHAGGAVHAGGGFHPGGGYHATAPAYRGGGGFRPASPGYRAGAVRPGVAPGRAPGFQHGAVGSRPMGAAVQRPWYHGGQAMMHNYRPFGWGGRSYYAFAPGRHFHPGFYNYFHTPWARPYPYGGWWGRAPWFPYYGSYFQPYPYYYGPSWWLTDWMIADMLSTQYAQSEVEVEVEDQQAAAAPISEDVKEQMRRQVEESVRAHEAEQSVDVASTLADPSHIYASSQPLGATLAGTSTTCTVAIGDLLRVAAPPAQGDQVASMVVVSAKKGSCPVGSTVLVSIADLQAFLNDFSERLEQGMEQMQTPQPGQPLQPLQQPQPAAPQP